MTGSSAAGTGHSPGVATVSEDRGVDGARERRAAARLRRQCELLQQRPDLAGVYSPADWSAEALRWCV
jgi:hypothetical protein